MKTAEEWYSQMKEVASHPDMCCCGPCQVSQIEWIEFIQADARHAALTEAADVCISDALMNFHDSEGNCLCGNCSGRRAILALRDKEKGQQ